MVSYIPQLSVSADLSSVLRLVCAPLEDVWAEGRGDTEVVRNGEAVLAKGDDGVARPAAVGEEVAGLLDGGEAAILSDLVDNVDEAKVPGRCFSANPAVNHMIIIKIIIEILIPRVACFKKIVDIHEVK